MLRSVLLPIVLSVLVGQHATLLCKAWCEPVAAAESECHDSEPVSAPVTVGQNSCDTLGPAVVLLREDVRRGAAAAGWSDAVVTLRALLASLAIGVDHRTAQERYWLLERRPLTIVLRI